MGLCLSNSNIQSPRPPVSKARRLQVRTITLSSAPPSSAPSSKKRSTEPSRSSGSQLHDHHHHHHQHHQHHNQHNHDADGDHSLMLSLRDAAQLGDAESQYRLAQCYHHGDRHHEVDMNQAIHYYTLAAKQHHAASQCLLGTLHEKGITDILPPNLPAAHHYYKQAASHGYSKAQYHLSNYILMYSTPLTSERMYEAFQWMERASNNNHIDALIQMARFYQTGMLQIIPKNTTYALQYYQKASKLINAHPQTMNAYASLYYQIGLLYEEEVHDSRLAIDAYLKGLDRDCTDCINKIALCMLTGKLGVSVNREKAVELFTRASLRGHVGARNHLEKCQSIAENGDGGGREPDLHSSP